MRRNAASLFFFIWCACSALAANDSPIIFLVRHAERAGLSGPAPADTHLSPAGRVRAQHLATVLKDAKISAIYTSEFARTQETAEPLARSLGKPAEVVTEMSRLVAKLKASRGNVLVVGHSNTLPTLIRMLGVAETVALPESEYDNLFVVTLEAQPHLLRLHYR